MLFEFLIHGTGSLEDAGSGGNALRAQFHEVLTKRTRFPLPESLEESRRFPAGCERHTSQPSSLVPALRP